MSAYLVALACMLGMVAGQLLFKQAAVAAQAAGALLAPGPLLFVGAAMLLYAGTSVAWVRLLQEVDLGRVYPFMALAFVLVPMGSWLLFGERFGARYVAGLALIVAGIVLTTRA